MFVTTYQNTDFKIFSEYIKSVFNPNYILGYEKYLKWQYSDSLYLLKAGDQIAGHFGFRDISYKVGEMVKNVRVLMNLFVLPQFRVSGGGAILSGKVFDTANAVMVSGYNPALHGLGAHLISGWKAAGNLSRFMAVLNPKNPMLAQYKSSWARPVRKRHRGWVVDLGISDPDVLERAWLESRFNYRLTVERSSSYVKWRFFDHPFIDYRVFVCFNNGSPRGYLIGRIEGNSVFKIARIIDLVAVEPADYCLISSFIDWAGQEFCDAADFMFSGKAHREALRDVGFFDVLDTDFADFPILFSPISNRKNFINIAYNLEFGLGECYFTKADGDQDRYNPY